MSRAGSSSDPPAGVRQSITGERLYKSKYPPLSLIVQRVGPPLRDPVVTDDAADNTDQCMTHAEACNDKEDNDDDNYEKSDNYDDADNEQNNSHKNKSNKDNDAQRIKRLAYLGKHPCIECGRHFPQSVWNITTCEPCDKYWGLKNGADKDGKKSHGYRPPGHQFFHSSQSSSAKAKARATVPNPPRQHQQLPPLVSSYEKQLWGVPPPPLPPPLQRPQHFVQPPQRPLLQEGPLHDQHDWDPTHDGWTEAEWLRWQQHAEWQRGLQAQEAVCWQEREQGWYHH